MVRKVPKVQRELTREERVEEAKRLSQEYSEWCNNYLTNLYRFYDQPRGSNFKVGYRVA